MMVEQSDTRHHVSHSSGSAAPPPTLPLVVLDNLEAIVYVADLESHEILYANSFLRNLFGFDPKGRRCWQLVHMNQNNSCLLCDRARLLAPDGTPGPPVYHEYQNPFNKKWYGAKDMAIPWSDGRLVRLEVALDITESKNLHLFVEEARLQAMSAVNAKNRFVALVAHDLKSPFVSILGMLKRILRKETFSHEIHRRFLENIITNGQRMLKMIDNLLDMDRLESGKIRPEPSHFDVSTMVAEVFLNFSHLAEQKHLRLCNEVAAETEVFADRYLYFVVLNNLISNAVKFSYPNGAIIVSYNADQARPCLVVRDQGVGVPAAYVEHLFKPDVKTTSKGTKGETGSGLGLVFCQQIMQAHGGALRLETEEGKGTTFFVELGPSCRLPEGQNRPL